MKNIKYIFAIVVVLFAMTISFGASAASIIYSGECGADGDNLTWALDSDYNLVISGSGDMKDYSSSDNRWRGNAAQIKSVSISEGVTSIGNYAFRNCSSLSEISIPEGLKTIGGYAFSSCSNLSSISLPDSLTTIKSSAFHGCSSFSSISIPSNVTSIGQYAFHSCSGIKSISIPNGVTLISNYSFANCSNLTSISIPDSVTVIDYCAFNACKKLKSITIPADITSIGSSAFYRCTDLTDVYFNGAVLPTISDDAFSGCTPTIHCLKNSDIETWAKGKGYTVKPHTITIDSGSCGADGDNVTWTLDSDGVLTICIFKV